MGSYRLYRIGPNERLLAPEAFDSISESAAIETAGRMLAGDAGELWRGGQLVGRFSKLGVFTRRET